MKRITIMLKEMLYLYPHTNSNSNYFPGSEINPAITYDSIYNCNHPKLKPNRKFFKQITEKIKRLLKTILSRKF